MKVKLKQQNFSASAQAVLKGKFIVVNTHIKDEEGSQIHNLNLQIKGLEKTN